MHYTEQLVVHGQCASALDIGCGHSSYLTAFRPRLKTVGLDAFPGAIAEARARNVHEAYILANVLERSAEDLLAEVGGEKFDLVTLYDVIEHVPKKMGYELLDKCERLTRKFVLLHTPNGFVEQGPEFGNEFQRHLSGWFPHDFEGIGYTVRGTGGLRAFHGYAGLFKWPFPGVAAVDALLFRLLRADHNPVRAFSLVAWKDVRGAAPRL